MNAKYIALWGRRIIEINKTGNCKSPIGTPYFSVNHDKDRMLFFCETQIEVLKKASYDNKKVL